MISITIGRRVAVHDDAQRGANPTARLFAQVGLSEGLGHELLLPAMFFKESPKEYVSFRVVGEKVIPEPIVPPCENSLRAAYEIWIDRIVCDWRNPWSPSPEAISKR